MHDNWVKRDDLVSLQISHHGDSINQAFIRGLPSETSQLLQNLANPLDQKDNSKLKISICHSEPGAWHPANYMTKQCPPPDFIDKADANATYYKSGRTVSNVILFTRLSGSRCSKQTHCLVDGQSDATKWTKYGLYQYAHTFLGILSKQTGFRQNFIWKYFEMEG